MRLSIEQAAPLAMGVLFLISSQNAFADQISSNFTRYDGDEIAKNPAAQNILQKIELSKKILEELKSGVIRTEQTEHQKFIDEQRKIAQEQLQKDLSKMNKDYEGYTPKNAYARFLNNIPSQYHEMYWEQFNHLDKKIQLAKAAKEQALANGGTYQDAMYEYYKHATTKKIELIQVNKDLNIKYKFTDTELQSYFDDNGKLPRVEEDSQPCFSCKRYEIIAQKIIEDSLLKTSNAKSLNSTQTA
jgi:hypothetical protein